MAFQLDALLRLFHIAGAALWVGAGIFLKTVVMKNVEKAGPPGKAYMMSVMRNGGWGKFIGPAAVVTVVMGLLLYWRLDIHTAAMDGSNAWITIGMVLGLVALGLGLGVIMPAEKAMKGIADTLKPGDGPTPEQGQQLEALAAKAGNFSVYATVLAGLTFVLMAGRHIFV